MLANPRFEVAQGSILGPLMFIFVLNDLPQAIRCGSINMYADDTTLYTAAKTTDKTIDMLRTDAQSTLEVSNSFLWLKSCIVQYQFCFTNLLSQSCASWPRPQVGLPKNDNEPEYIQKLRGKRFADLKECADTYPWM